MGAAVSADVRNRGLSPPLPPGRSLGEETSLSCVEKINLVDFSVREIDGKWKVNENIVKKMTSYM